MVKVCGFSTSAIFCVLPLLVFDAFPVSARPVDRSNQHPLIEATGDPIELPGISGKGSTFNTVFYDTLRFGGTFWAADSGRWEALRDSVWTFESGVGSAFGPTGPNKPAGYHTRMEGWYGIDQSLSPVPYFRRSTTCAIAGSYSYWAGVTLSEAQALCFASGQGYGNGWHMEVRKTFAYPGTGNVTLSYRYANDTEAAFDFSYVTVDTSGTGATASIELANYDGQMSGTATHTLVPGVTLPSSSGNIVITFVVDSDGSYSDEDGLNATTCGAFAVDNVTLSGAISDFSDFETGENGWLPFVPTTGIGDFSNLAHVGTDLTPPTFVFCRCGARDSVLVFYDPMQEHPLDQDNIAASPWINLKRSGDLGRPGKLFFFSIVNQAPLESYIFYQIRMRWYPSICAATGLVFRTPWRDAPQFFPDNIPFCTPEGLTQLRDVSGVIETGAEQIQLAVGLVNLCRTAPFGVPCSGVTNTTPWFDNISLGLYGSGAAPNLSILTFDFFQDNFAADGTLNPASTGRIDTNTLKNASAPGPGSILRDTLNARGDGGNTEVRLVFRIRPGPFTNSATLAYYQGRWTPEPSLGANWYSARMDTAEQGGILGNPRSWMTTYHELDPGFQGTDRTADLLDPSQLENEIIPDHLFTPGSRIDYFVKSRYIPPDPRNPGGMDWYIVPDTTGGRYQEVEILPSSMASDTTWNCTLYVDHHDDRSSAQQKIEEDGLTAALGLGSNNFEGTRYDRFDVETPSSGQMSFGRPIHTNYGASIIQTFAFKNIVWHTASLSSLQLTDEDASVLGPWLTLRGIGGNRFWGSGAGLATSMNGSGEPTTVAFMLNVLGVIRSCNTIRDVNCPSGTPLDSTYCIPLMPPIGAEFFAPPISARGNGCPDLESFDLLAANPAVSTAKGLLSYEKSGGFRPSASVSNEVTVDVDYKTVLDGFGVGHARTTPIDPHNQALCTDVTGAVARTGAVLDWFDAGLVCRTPAGLANVPGFETPRPSQFRTLLGYAYPNPMSPATRISFTNGVEGGRVRLQLFDVTGRLVRTLLDSSLPAGVHEIAWDGRSDAGGTVRNGMYFYRLSAPGYQSARKLLVMR
jgi:hypothetical protein